MNLSQNVQTFGGPRAGGNLKFILVLRMNLYEKLESRQVFGGPAAEGVGPIRIRFIDTSMSHISNHEHLSDPLKTA